MTNYWLWIIPKKKIFSKVWDLCIANNVLAMHYPLGLSGERRNQNMAKKIAVGDYIIAYRNQKTIGGIAKATSAVYKAPKNESWWNNVIDDRGYHFGFRTRIKIKWILKSNDGWRYNNKIDNLIGLPSNALKGGTIHHIDHTFYTKTKIWAETQLQNEIIDKLTNINTITQLDDYLKEINMCMHNISPVKIVHIMVKIRTDRKFIKLWKQKYSYRCQFPNCNSRIRTRQGHNYVEVAHIMPVSNGGQSIIGNLVVLCPNHHKEFDLGHREIQSQTDKELVGILNGTPFTIKF